MAYGGSSDKPTDKRTASQIRRARSRAVGGSRKRCSKGKSCSATCINAGKVCEVEATPTVSSAMPKAASLIQRASKGTLEKSLSGKPSDRASLAEAKMNLNKIRANARKLEREGKLDASAREQIRDVVRAQARALKAEDVSLFKSARKDMDKGMGRMNNPDADKMLKGIRVAERGVRVQSELIKILNEKIDKLPSGESSSGRRDKLIRRREEAEKLKSLYEKEVKDRKSAMNNLIAAAVPARASSMPGLTDIGKQARENLKTVLGELSRLPRLIRIGGNENSENINWNAAVEAGATRLGKPGLYGAFVRIPANNLFKVGVKGDYPSGVGVKSGKIGLEEPGILKRVGEAGLGPKLIAARMDPSRSTSSDSEERRVRRGLIAMGIVPGTDVFSYNSPRDKVNGVEVGDAFWRARRDLHRMGIAHNDMHPGNVLIDSKGVARFVDFGLAQASPRAALAEAIGAVTRSDWQVNRWQVLGGDEASLRGIPPAAAYRRMNGNWVRLKSVMKGDGFTDAEIRAIGNAGIRRYGKDDFRTGPWLNSALTDNKIREYIDILYDGI